MFSICHLIFVIILGLWIETGLLQKKLLPTDLTPLFPESSISEPPRLCPEEIRAIRLR